MDQLINQSIEQEKKTEHDSFFRWVLMEASLTVGLWNRDMNNIREFANGSSVERRDIKEYS